MVVALRKESVDRNPNAVMHVGMIAWVALRKESVDRNVMKLPLRSDEKCRSPQGERG